MSEPRVIVEIGSDRGENTLNLLRYCRAHDAKLHVIDPSPKYDVAERREEHGRYATFHQELSLNALYRIDGFDAVLIDGDHNWYTVINELRLIEKQCRRFSRRFPLVLLHDTGWPYARRDLYYDPEVIPDAYRKPYKKLGLAPDSPELLERGGINRHLNNAVYENSLQNGVLTAVEDFLHETDSEVGLVRLPGLHGLSILVPPHLRKREGLSSFLTDLDLAPVVERYIERLENERQNAELSRQKDLQARDGLKSEVVGLKKDLQIKETEIGALRKQAEHTDLLLSSTKEELEEVFEAHADARRRCEGLEAELQARSEALREEEEKVADLTRRLKEEKNRLSETQKEVSSLRSRSEILATGQQARETELFDLRNLLRGQEQQLLQAKRDTKSLARWIEQLYAGISALLESRRWRTGHFLGELYRRFLSKAGGPMVLKDFEKTMAQFRAWREATGDESGLPQVHPSTPPGPRPTVSPDSRSTSRHEHLSTLPPEARRVDVVVCVHNALEDVKACLSSVIENSPEMSTLYVVDDGSEAPTENYLREFCSDHEPCILLKSVEAGGYTRAANKGLRVSSADYVVLLNSDTIVPLGWLEKILECGESDPRIGIVGPLSNAASWQSVPEVNDGGDWAVNSLPDGYTVDGMATLVAGTSQRRFPRTPFLNGFCLAIKRPLIDAIGYFDEQTFPHGYGEENDYCIRATEAGFELAIADHAYVYHAKSKSYSHTRRRALSRPGGAALRKKHGPEKVSGGVELMRKEPTLERIRQRLRRELQAGTPGVHETNGSFKVLFLLPCGGGGGGVHSVVQEGQGMLDMGVFTQIAVQGKHREQYLKSYPNADPDLFYFFASDEALIDHARNFDVVVATIFTSVRLLKRICESVPNILPSYYVQDYEAWFGSLDRDEAREAEASYTAVPNAVLFAKTDWLCQMVQNLHGIKVRKVSPSLDHTVYYPKFDLEDDPVVKVAAMVRPRTPRRSPLQTMKVLKAIKEKYGDGVSVTIFGCEPHDPQFLALPRNFEFENRGVLLREEVAEVLREANVFLDLSTYQAFGRTGLEAMACGCATVLPKNGGTSEYARHRENALLVDTSDFDDMLCAVEELLDNEALRREISERSISTASEYTIRKAALSELSLFKESIQKRDGVVSGNGRAVFGLTSKSETLEGSPE